MVGMWSSRAGYHPLAGALPRNAACPPPIQTHACQSRPQRRPSTLQVLGPVGEQTEQIVHERHPQRLLDVVVDGLYAGAGLGGLDILERRDERGLLAQALFQSVLHHELGPGRGVDPAHDHAKDLTQHQVHYRCHDAGAHARHAGAGHRHHHDHHEKPTPLINGDSSCLNAQAGQGFRWTFQIIKGAMGCESRNTLVL